MDSKLARRVNLSIVDWGIMSGVKMIVVADVRAGSETTGHQL
jgi:hypothetical protein